MFRVPGSESYIQGDVNNDGKVDGNDLTSYMNYTGLRLGDSDFEGYISRGDIDGNNLIDAYDISVAATQLEGGVQPSDEERERLYFRPMAGVSRPETRSRSTWAAVA